ncbi:hydantoinase B/oxoprolinase family protein [Roseibacillus ishigakijimensis]|uniref:Hydantoinase B/oxoprolinase family protein n=1 Tax=Roseibacillus ishigakijimensis TaxID=454146 RepID=A0A934RVK3_9BACT|nr:hydantoinase B/oxoprolinase family protein [Roseibacillus ishigakijimensis]MBK1835251.1 hydantoinase B/oxoprolinase family protein [Roseibacillus ishigakijimensis]
MKKWLVRVDTGGTFTDGWAVSPGGEESRCKVLSSGCLRAKVLAVESGGLLRVKGLEDYPEDFFVGWSAGELQVRASRGGELTLAGSFFPQEEIVELSTGEEAPVLAARVLTRTPWGQRFPEMDFRVATTRGTNALLENKGTAPVLFITAGFRDLPEIRDQRRPDLFARAIVKKPSITRKIVEVDHRLAVDGEVLRPLEEEKLRAAAAVWRAQGEEVAVVAFLHADRHPEDERRAKEILLEEGFREVTTSAELGARLGFLPRMETALANGYLAPVMNSFKRRVSQAGETAFLTSAGGLQSGESYEPVDSLLSGPAGGLVGALAIARAAGFSEILTFDMGGTSTDVARLEGHIPLRYEQEIGPVKVRRPGVKMETVAAGGGSICRWHQGGLEVGPHSAGAEPGPACYGRGGPLTVTDVNFLLGYLDEERVEIPLSRAAARERLAELKAAMAAEGVDVPGDEELLRGLRAIAIERMAEAVRSISVGEGFEPGDYTLVAFGGAGPQHACELAESLGVSRVLIPADAGLLSAWGLHRSRREGVAERQVLQLFEEVAPEWSRLRREISKRALAQVPGSQLTRWLIEVRLAGQASAIELIFPGEEEPDLEQVAAEFATRYEQLFGYPLPAGLELEVVTVRVVASEAEANFPEEEFSPPREAGGLQRSNYCTILVGEGWTLRAGSAGSVLLEKEFPAQSQAREGVVGEELMRARLESIATSMGELLRRTALSTNVKERLDFSCALLDGRGRLLVNAPHVPVHLGALGVCVRAVSQGRDWLPGDVLVVNHPAFGGSHLPDVTVVSPVFGEAGRVIAFVANRAHHSEIGGRAPGSMPGDARHLVEEGVVIAPFLLQRAGEEHFDELEDLLCSAPFPSRAVEENLADLRAQAAANRAGVHALRALLAEYGEEPVVAGMEALYGRAARVMAEKLLPAGTWRACDELDDGTPLAVSLAAEAGHLTIDFSGTAARHPGNLNATAGVTRSAILYALRLWLDDDLPLNEGLLDAVEIQAQGTFLQPDFPADPARCPAVVGGNVETSQRVVELLLRALGVVAESQGTMNNFLFGNGKFGYYETIGGGAGALHGAAGASGVHVHMTNTAITDPEVLEYRFPVRLREFSLREDSGGTGRWRGGDGLVREVEFLEKMTVTLLTQHRKTGPRGFAGGGAGAVGRQRIWEGAAWRDLPATVTCEVAPGYRLRLETPGGGAWGSDARKTE